MKVTARGAGCSTCEPPDVAGVDWQHSKVEPLLGNVGLLPNEQAWSQHSNGERTKPTLLFRASSIPQWGRCRQGLQSQAQTPGCHW